MKLVARSRDANFGWIEIKVLGKGEFVNHHHKEVHRSHRVGWLRASVLGANDGLLSTASLVIGVASANSTHQAVLLSGVAGLVAGAMSMAAGEYVSVSTQKDTEQADLAMERRELQESPEEELLELAAIYETRGLTADLALQVAQQLTQKDALAAHAREELGITEEMAARPIQAAMASAGSFAIGAAVPLLVASLTEGESLVVMVGIVSMIGLAGLGALAAYAGGAPVAKGAIRVLFWGVLAMGFTSLIGKLFGASMIN